MYNFYINGERQKFLINTTVKTAKNAKRATQESYGRL